MTAFTVLIVVLLSWLAWNALRPSDRPGAKRSRKNDTGWLQDRWDLAARMRGNPGGIFPGWYFDRITEWQARRLDEDGVKWRRTMTKGQASDLIGLSEPADASDLEVLRFFKRSTRGMNQTRARHEAALILSDAANGEAWEARPMDTRQRELFRFFGEKVRAGIGYNDAASIINGLLSKAQESGSPLVSQWATYNHILDEFDDRDFRDTYGIKRPGMNAIRAAVDSLIESGVSWDDLDSDQVAEKLIAMRPDIEI